MHKRNDNAGSGITDSVAESNGTTSRVVVRGRLRKFVALKITYPFTLIFEGSMLQTFSAMRTTTENASFSSNWAMSFTVRLAFLRARGTALVGASGKSMGSTPASAQATKSGE